MALTRRMKWRKFWRWVAPNPFVRDLRLIQLDKRHLYRGRFYKGSLGWALNALFNAYHAGHLK
jgi:hypothetical protein